MCLVIRSNKKKKKDEKEKKRMIKVKKFTTRTAFLCALLFATVGARAPTEEPYSARYVDFNYTNEARVRDLTRRADDIINFFVLFSILDYPHLDARKAYREACAKYSRSVELGLG